MKLTILILLILKISQFKCKFFKTISHRTKMNNLACNLSEKFEEISGIEKSYVELSDSISDSDSLINLSPKYLEFLDVLKKDKTMSDEFLIIKMFYGDNIASRLYLDLATSVDNKKNSKNEEINEDEVLSRVKDMASMTKGIGAKNFAQYQATQFLKEYKLKDNKYRCDISFEDENYNSEKERKYRMASGEKYLGWNSIKYLKYPKSPKIRNSTHWLTKWNKFPAVVEYGKNNLNDCNYESNATSTYVDELKDISLHKNCEIQLIGDQTRDTEKREVVNLSIDGKNFKVKFFVSEKILDYNCLGWAIGVMDFINPHIYTDPPRKVQTKKELKLYLKQFKEAMTTIKRESENSKGNVTEANNSDKASLLEKIKPSPSLIDDLMEKNIKIDGDDHIIGITDSITQAQISNLCKENLSDAVIFYGSEGQLTHAARFHSELNTWTSKMGYSWLVTHSLHLLDDIPKDKSIYGKPKFLYCPKGVNSKAEGSMPSRNHL